MILKDGDTFKILFGREHVQGHMDSYLNIRLSTTNEAGNPLETTKDFLIRHGITQVQLNKYSGENFSDNYHTGALTYEGLKKIFEGLLQEGFRVEINGEALKLSYPDTYQGTWNGLPCTYEATLTTTTLQEVTKMELKEIKKTNLKEAKKQFDTEKANAEIEFAKKELRALTDVLNRLDQVIKANNEQRDEVLDKMKVFQ